MEEVLNTEDNNTVQAQDVDNLVSEIREIADNIYQEGSQEPSNPIEARNTFENYRTPHDSQSQFFQPHPEDISREPETEVARPTDTPQALKKPPVNPGDISKGLSKLHARVDEVLRNTPSSKGGQAMNSSFSEANARALSSRQSLIPSSAERNIRPELATTNFDEMARLNSFTGVASPTSYGNIPRPPSASQMPSVSGHTRTPGSLGEASQGNPFSQNALTRTGEVEARRSMAQDIGNYNTAFSSQFSPNSTGNIAQSAFWSANPDATRVQRDERAFKSSIYDAATAKPFPKDFGPSRVGPDQNTAGFSELPTAMTSGSPAATGTFFGVNNSMSTSLQASSSAPNLKPRYDKSKLDQILANIKNRESGGTPSGYRPPAMTSVTPVKPTESFTSPQGQYYPGMSSAISPTMRTQEPDAKRQRSPAPSFPNEPSSNLRMSNYEPQTQAKPDFFSPRQFPQTTVSQYNSLNQSNMMSPSQFQTPGQFQGSMQFQSPQNFMPTTQSMGPTNPFNPLRSSAVLEEGHTDYYGILQQPEREPERQTRQQPGYYPPEEIETDNRNQFQPRGYQQQQAPRASGYGQQDRARFSEKQERFGSGKQERYNPQERFGSGKQEKYNVQERFEERPQKQVQNEEFVRRNEPAPGGRRGVKRTLEGRDYREEQRGDDFCCGEVENDDDSLIMEPQEEMRSEMRSLGMRSGSNFYCGVLEDDSDRSLSSIKETDRDEKVIQPSQQPGRRSSNRPLREVRQEEVYEKPPVMKISARTKQEPVVKAEEPEPRRSRRSSRNRKPALGGGELVYNTAGSNRDEFGNIQRKPVQTFGKEQGRGGSVPRRAASRERGTGYPKMETSGDFFVKDEGSMRGTAHAHMLGSSGKKKSSQKKFMDNEEELSDFDFDTNKVDARDENSPDKRDFSRKKNDDDSITRAFEHAKYEHSDRKSTGTNRLRDSGTQKTEMIFNSGPTRAARRRVYA